MVKMFDISTGKSSCFRNWRYKLIMWLSQGDAIIINAKFKTYWSPLDIAVITKNRYSYIAHNDFFVDSLFIGERGEGEIVSVGPQ